MNISQLISTRNSWGPIYTVGPKKELKVRYDTYRVMVQPVVELVSDQPN